MGKGKEIVKLDEILKSLFSTSNQVLVNFINAIFEEDFSHNEVKISIGNNEFSLENSNYDIVRGDLFLQLSEIEMKDSQHQYHVEFQTRNDTSMAIRMFEYGFNKAREVGKLNNKQNVLILPKQVVMFIEKNENIQDKLKLTIVSPNGDTLNYEISTVRYWEYGYEELVEEKLYILLPLQIFKFRKELEKVYKSDKKDTKERLTKILEEAKEMAYTLSKQSKSLYEDKELFDEDLHKIFLSIQNLIVYLNRKYGDDDKIEKDVNRMTKSLYDPLVKEKGKIEGKIESIMVILQEKFNLSLEDTDKIAKKIKNVKDLDRINELFKESLKCTDLEEFIKKM